MITPGLKALDLRAERFQAGAEGGESGIDLVPLGVAAEFFECESGLGGVRGAEIGDGAFEAVRDALEPDGIGGGDGLVHLSQQLGIFNEEQLPDFAQQFLVAADPGQGYFAIDAAGRIGADAFPPQW